MEERLQKFIARCGIASRRKAEELILNGKIKVNGKIVTELGTKILPDKDTVEYEGRTIELHQEKIYYVLNKPLDYATTATHGQDEKIVTDLVPKNPRVFPIGRLDKNTTGLLILTNDGELANQIMHPKFSHEKEYWVVCSVKHDFRNENKIEKIIQKMQSGVAISNQEFVSGKIKDVKFNHNYSIVSFNMILTEGKNRQIRKMTEKIGLSVLRLKRIRINNLLLGNLQEGEYRKISKNDIEL